MRDVCVANKAPSVDLVCLSARGFSFLGLMACNLLFLYPNIFPAMPQLPPPVRFQVFTWKQLNVYAVTKGSNCRNFSAAYFQQFHGARNPAHCDSKLEAIREYRAFRSALQVRFLVAFRDERFYRTLRKYVYITGLLMFWRMRFKANRMPCVSAVYILVFLFIVLDRVKREAICGTRHDCTRFGGILVEFSCLVFVHEWRIITKFGAFSFVFR